MTPTTIPTPPPITESLVRKIAHGRAHGFSWDDLAPEVGLSVRELRILPLRFRAVWDGAFESALREEWAETTREAILAMRTQIQTPDSPAGQRAATRLLISLLKLGRADQATPEVRVQQARPTTQNLDEASGSAPPPTTTLALPEPTRPAAKPTLTNSPVGSLLSLVCHWVCLLVVANPARKVRGCKPAYSHLWFLRTGFAQLANSCRHTLYHWAFGILGILAGVRGSFGLQILRHRVREPNAENRGLQERREGRRGSGRDRRHGGNGSGAPPRRVRRMGEASERSTTMSHVFCWLRG
jgi:hypothetical protein